MDILSNNILVSYQMSFKNLYKAQCLSLPLSSPAMELRAVCAVNALYALRQSSITESCQPMLFVPQNNPSLLILVSGIHQKFQ